MSTPFSLLRNGIWELVERNAALLSYIPSRNRIKYDTEKTQKHNVSHGDTPELALVPIGGGPDIDRSRDVRVIRKRYLWAITTGDLDNDTYDAISWELYRSMIDWNSTLCPIEWEGHTFIENFLVLDEEVGLKMIELNRQIDGWSAFWTVEAMLQFCTSTIRI